MHSNTKTSKNILSRILKGAFIISIPAFFSLWIYFLWEKVPSQIHIKQGQVEEFDFAIPAIAQISKQNKTIGSVDLGKPITLYAGDTDKYQMSVKLFGLFDFKETEVSVINDIELMPVGRPIGIYVKTKGILVIDSGEFEGADGITKAPAELLKEGDYILGYNGEEINLKQDLINNISECNGEDIVLTINRQGEIFDLKITPQKNKEGEYKLGIWVRDNAQGVGTMTYITKDREFGALGHGINDLDTATLMSLDHGNLYQADIISVKKGIAGEPGEITGYISYNKEEYLGNVAENTKEGIYGKITDVFYDDINNDFLEIGLKQDVRLGDIQILCTLDETPEYYDAEITDIYFQSDNINRGFRIHVTDEELLDKTGGIVQGMSGSPIVQDGKIIGAVTHVLVNDPTRGYGIFIENMLEH